MRKDLELYYNSMQTSSKLIKFFVQHMLDMAVLNQKAKNFMKDISKFDLKQAINEIISILAEKIAVKQIKLF